MERDWSRRFAGGLMVLLLALAAPAAAQTRAALMKELEGSMLVEGRIDVAADGTVSAYSIRDTDQVDPLALQHLARHVPAWTVYPATVDGEPVASSSPFSVRLVARRVDDRNYVISIAGASIREDLPEAARLRADRMQPPRFPRDMVALGGTGIVHLLLRIDGDGRVLDTHVEQVDLTVLARPKVAQHIRKRLAEAALEVAPAWTFHPPSAGQAAGRTGHVLRVPVEFSFEGNRTVYGQWRARVPGKREPAPWAHPEDDGADSRVAGIPGRPTLVGSGLRLSSALEPGA